MITKEIIYKSVNDLISDSYDWIADKENQARAIGYIMGINSMADYLVEQIDERYKHANDTYKEELKKLQDAILLKTKEVKEGNIIPTKGEEFQ